MVLAGREFVAAGFITTATGAVIRIGITTMAITTAGIMIAGTTGMMVMTTDTIAIMVMVMVMVMIMIDR